VSDTNAFVQLLRRAQARDQQAATELMRTYEPAVRRAVRLRLFDARLRRIFDSTDICQSVMGTFFTRLARGQFPLESPEQLVKLLITMAHNKLTDQVRRQQAQRRDARQVAGFALEDEECIAPGPSPSKEIEVRELLEAVRQRMTPEERQLLEMRHEGWDWNDIADKIGSTPEALRKKLSRALQRVQEDVGLAI
jgi:RNA polymerase sigma-70 factor (ECF subfamily)